MHSNRRRLGLCALALMFVLSACGGQRPPSLLEQTRAFPDPVDAPAWATLGWWHYLSGDAQAARQAFTRSGGTALGRLGVARLARDRLDQALVNATLNGLEASGPLGQIAAAWRDGSGGTLAPRGVSASISRLPSLTLHQLGERPPKLSERSLVILGQTQPLSPLPLTGQPEGVRVGIWTQPEGSSVRVKTSGAAILWSAERELRRMGPSSGSVSSTLGPMDAPLIVAWVGPELPQVRVIPTGEKFTGTSLPVVPDRGRSVDWLKTYLNAEAARVTGAFERADTYLSEAPNSPAFEALRAELVESESGLPSNVVRDRALSHWRRAVELAPIRAQLKMGDHLRSAGRHRASLEHLTVTLSQAPNREVVYVSYIRTLLALGRHDDARRVFSNLDALKLSPCAHIRLRQRVFGRSAPAAMSLAEMLSQCGRGLDGVRHLLAMSRPQEALRLLDGMQERPEGVAILRARVLLALGRVDDAREVIADSEGGAERHLGLDLSGAPLSATRAEEVREWVLDNIDNPDALSSMDARSEWSPFAHLFSRTEAAIESYEREGDAAGRATRVLDHSVLYFGRHGRSVRRVHEVLAISSRQAAEEFGELALPEEARAVLVYTRKADGRLRFAESTPEKESLSLPDLEAGDYLVAIYLEPGDNGYLYSHGFLSQRAYFADLGVNIFRQTFDVIPPPGLEPRVEASDSISQIPAGSVGDRQVLRFRRDGAEAVSVEPRSLDPALFMPSLRIGGGVSLRESVDRLRDQVLRQREITYDFRAFIKKEVGELQGREAVRMALRAVRGRYDASDGLVDYPVRRGLYDGHGHRALAFSAALEVLGVEHQLFLARPNHDRPPTRFLTTDDFEVALIRLSDDTWVYPIHDSGAPGYLPFPLLGGQGVQLWPIISSVEPAPLPEQRQVRDSRRSSLRARWTSSGKLIGEIEDILTGQEAVSIAGYLRELEPSQRPRLIERLLVHVISTARVTHLEPLDLNDSDTLALRYRFEAMVGDQMNLGLFPMRAGRTFASLVERTTPLYIDLPAHQQVDIMIESERPLRTSATSAEHVSGDHRISRQVAVDGETITVSSSLDVQGGLVSPAAYSEFRAWARIADGLERVVINAQAPLTSRSTKTPPLAGRPLDGDGSIRVDERP